MIGHEYADAIRSLAARTSPAELADEMLASADTVGAAMAEGNTADLAPEFIAAVYEEMERYPYHLRNEPND